MAGAAAHPASPWAPEESAERAIGHLRDAFRLASMCEGGYRPPQQPVWVKRKHSTNRYDVRLPMRWPNWERPKRMLNQQGRDDGWMENICPRSVALWMRRVSRQTTAPSRAAKTAPNAGTALTEWREKNFWMRSGNLVALQARDATGWMQAEIVRGPKCWKDRVTVQPRGDYPNCATCPIDEFKEQWERRHMVVEQSRLRQVPPDTYEQDMQVAYLLSLRLQLLQRWRYPLDLDKRPTNFDVQARPTHHPPLPSV